MLTSTAMIDPIAGKLANLSPQEWPKALQIETTPLGVNSVRLSVAVLPDAKLADGAAAKVLNALVQAAKVSVGQIGQQQSQAAKTDSATLEHRYNTAKKKLKTATAALMTASRSARGFDPESRLMTGRTLAAERDGLSLTLAGNRARLKVLEEELQKLQPGSTSKADSKPDPAAAGNGETASARRSVYDQFNSERINLRLGIAEAEARLKIIETRLAASPTSQPEPPDIAQLQSDQEEAQREVATLERQMEVSRRDGQDGAIRLIVLNGQPDSN